MLLGYTVTKVCASARKKFNLVHQTVSPRERVESEDNTTPIYPESLTDGRYQAHTNLVSFPSYTLAKCSKKRPSNFCGFKLLVVYEEIVPICCVNDYCSLSGLYKNM